MHELRCRKVRCDYWIVNLRDLRCWKVRQCWVFVLHYLLLRILRYRRQRGVHCLQCRIDQRLYPRCLHAVPCRNLHVGSGFVGLRVVRGRKVRERVWVHRLHVVRGRDEREPGYGSDGLHKLRRWHVQRRGSDVVHGLLRRLLFERPRRLRKLRRRKDRCDVRTVYVHELRCGHLRPVVWFERLHFVLCWYDQCCCRSLELR